MQFALVCVSNYYVPQRIVDWFLFLTLSGANFKIKTNNYIDKWEFVLVSICYKLAGMELISFFINWKIKEIKHSKCSGTFERDRKEWNKSVHKLSKGGNDFFFWLILSYFAYSRRVFKKNMYSSLKWFNSVWKPFWKEPIMLGD